MKRNRIFYLIMCMIILSFLLMGCSRQMSSEGEREDTQAITQQTGESTEQYTENTEQLSEENEEYTEENSLENLKNSWNFEDGSIMLDKVLADLDREEIHYVGYFNTMRERLDVTLEDGTTLIFLATKMDEEASGWERQPSDYELMMKGTELNDSHFQENFLHEYDVTTDEYYFPNLSEPLEQNLWYQEQTGLSIARNQVYARYGRIFEDPFLNAVFRRKSWYEPKYTAEEFANLPSPLTETEQENLKELLAIEDMMNLAMWNIEGFSSPKCLLSGSWIDFDGDGIEEQISDDSEYCYIASLDGSTIQLLEEEGTGSSRKVSFYQYIDGEFQKLGTISSYINGMRIGSGRIQAMVIDGNNSAEHSIQKEFVVENGKIVELRDSEE